MDIPLPRLKRNRQGQKKGECNHCVRTRRALNQAVINNDVTALRALLDAGADPNRESGDSRRRTARCPIELAIDHECIGALNVLLRENVNLNLGRPLLHQAVSTGKLDTVKALVHNGFIIDSQDDKHRTPLILAAEAGMLAIVEFLLEQGKGVDVSPALISAIKGSSNNKIAVVNYLLAAGADPNSADEGQRTSLHHASSMMNEGAILEILLDAGADANKRVTGPDGSFTALHIAARYNNMGAVRALLDDGGCDVIALSEGTACVSAAQLALALGHVETAELIYFCGG